MGVFSSWEEAGCANNDGRDRRGGRWLTGRRTWFEDDGRVDSVDVVVAVDLGFELDEFLGFDVEAQLEI